MKKIINTGFLLVSIIVLAGCSISNNNNGSIPIMLPEKLSARESIATYEYARIMLKTTNGFINIDSSTSEVYQDVSYSAGSYVIEDINPSYTYDLIILFGNKIDSVFTQITNYAISENIQVTAGVNNEIEMIIALSDFVWESDYLGENVQQIINVDGNIYSKTPDMIYKDGDAMDLIYNSLSGDVTSIGHGENISNIDQLWINTTDGIYPVSSEGVIDETFSDGLIVYEDLNISESGTIKIINGNGTALFAYFQGNGSFGGVNYKTSTESSQWEWFSKSDLLEIMPEMSEMLSGIDKIVYDFLNTESYGIVSTALPVASFKISGDTTESADTLFSDPGYEPTFDDLKTLVSFIVVRDSDERQVTVTSLGLADSTLYLGSDNGIYCAGIDTTTGELIESGDVRTLVTGTDDMEILQIESSGSDYIAARTDKGIVIIEGTSVIMEYSLYQGLPGTLSDITWKDSILYISGSAGVVTLDVSQL
eukprot:Anaeramoba_ignava/a480330_69.p1 GENE.a480330_69~~a480330_69.p1  ORF type:complete len:480 (-),score=19.63 a480330_69:78-1517(-)